MPQEERDARSPREPQRTTRLKILAVVSGLLGAVLALAVPFLPVHHDITTINWPTEQGTRSVSAPLSTYSPTRIDVEVPCQTARNLDARSAEPAALVNTNPPNSEYGTLTGLVLQVDNGNVNLISRGQQLGSAPLPQGDCTISAHSDGYRTTASIGAETFVSTEGDQRPQLTGVYSDLDAQRDDVRGVSFEAEVDNRFQSYPTLLKTLVIVLALIAFGCSLFALRRFDVRSARRPRRLAPSRWWKPTTRDIAVVSALIVWWLLGAMTADDGYFLTMARVREDLGYVSDFYRWFAAPVAPMGWFVDVYSWWVQISTFTPWVRLPALIMGVGSWLLISRQVLPRLGQQVRRSKAAAWAAAAVFLASWLPYNNGLRPEPVVVVCALLSLCAVERAVATGRMLPAAFGLVSAALGVAANPHGMVAVLPFVVAYKPLFQLVHRRAKEYGWLPILAPIATTGLIILTLAFGDQTWQSVADSTDVRKAIGPNHTWYEELHRYILLFSPGQDGSLTRRFPILLVMLCLATCAVMLLRRGQIRGAALGPSRRLLGIAALYFVALALTPTKHSHHFGIFAAVGGALAALTALAASSTVLRSRRNRSVFFAGLMVILAFSATGPNAWWYVSSWGVPWFDKPPSFGGFQASTMLLLVAGIALIVAFVEHLRIDEHRPDPGVEKRSSALRRGTAPLSLICALLVVGEVAVFAKAVQEQWGSYSLGYDNVKQLAGSSCGMSDYVDVESDPLAGMLQVSPDQPATAVPGMRAPERNGTREPANEYLRAHAEGFERNALPPGDGSSPEEPDWSPPHQFGGPEAPVWGSYQGTESGTGELRTQWYDLPGRATNGEVPVVTKLAGQDQNPNEVYIELGRETEQGFEIMERRPISQQAPPQWGEHRTLVNDVPGATKLRVVAYDQAFGSDGWLAVSAPRAPHLERMTDVVGNAPTFVEWPAALVHPCLRITSIHNGIAEMPRFRVAAGEDVRDVGQSWAAPDAGGTFGWMNVTASMRELPTYLKNDIQRDWGSLYAVDPYQPDALPARTATEVRTETHWGLWSPGPFSKTIMLPGDVPSSDDRTDDDTSGSVTGNQNGR